MEGAVLMARKKDVEALRGKCRYCGGAVIYWHADEQVEQWGTMVHRSRRSRWWHLNPDPEKSVNESVYTDTKWKLLGAYCHFDPNAPDAKNLRGQSAEPLEYCNVMTGGHRVDHVRGSCQKGEGVTP
jgi:hypothetical protein